MIVINIDGLEPVAKGRARSTKSGHHYTPTKTRKFEEAVRFEATRQMRENGCKMIEVGVILRLSFRMPIPKSWPQWKKDMAANGDINHVSRPDVDNLVKAQKDALNGVLWRDDSQVVFLHAIKRYADNAGIDIIAWESQIPGADVVTRPK